jgi:hypothetical protein
LNEKIKESMVLLQEEKEIGLCSTNIGLNTFSRPQGRRRQYRRNGDSSMKLSLPSNGSILSDKNYGYN